MDEWYMQKAIDLAKLGTGKTFTNPLVGAVIVKNNAIISTGYHRKYGEQHAEKMAIDQCATPEDLVDSTLYVTLEPCNHYGKQPPCSHAIVASGITKVVIAQLDPNPIVAGAGVTYLEQNNIEVVVGILQEQAEMINEHYNYFHRYGKPFITLKQAISLDGKIAQKDLMRTQITNSEANKQVHEERSQFQAILVGSRTVLADDPQLLTTGDTEYPPIRIILDRQGVTLDFQKFKLYQSDLPIWIFTGHHTANQIPNHVRLFKDDDWTIAKVVDALAKEGVQSIYVEGGAKIHDAFLANNLFEEVITYIAPKLIGGQGTPSFSSEREIETPIPLTFHAIEKLGADLRIVSRRRT